MKSPSDIVGATCFTFQPSGIASANGAVNPKWSFYMRHGDNPAFWCAHLLMPGAVRDGVVYEVIPTDDVETEVSVEIDGGRFFKCGLKSGGQVFETYIWARNNYELRKMCRHIGAMMQIWEVDTVTHWQRLKCVLRYFWLRRPTIKLRSPVTP